MLTEGGSRAVAARLCLTGLMLFTSTGGLRVLSHRPPVHRAAHGEAEDGFVQRVRPRCRLGLELRVGGACASPQSWGAGVCHAGLKLGALGTAACTRLRDLLLQPACDRDFLSL